MVILCFHTNSSFVRYALSTMNSITITFEARIWIFTISFWTSADRLNPVSMSKLKECLHGVRPKNMKIIFCNTPILRHFIVSLTSLFFRYSHSLSLGISLDPVIWVCLFFLYAAFTAFYWQIALLFTWFVVLTFNNVIICWKLYTHTIWIRQWMKRIKMLAIESACSHH